jgi:hypothetical protein
MYSYVAAVLLKSNEVLVVKEDQLNLNPDARRSRWSLVQSSAAS